MNAGIIRVSDELILGLLDFEGGQVLALNKPFSLHGVSEILIEHPDMPERLDGETYTVVNTLYKIENGKVKRVIPPKED